VRLLDSLDLPSKQTLIVKPNGGNDIERRVGMIHEMVMMTDDVMSFSDDFFLDYRQSCVDIFFV